MERIKRISIASPRFQGKEYCLDLLSSFEWIVVKDGSSNFGFMVDPSLDEQTIVRLMGGELIHKSKFEELIEGVA